MAITKDQALQLRTFAESYGILVRAGVVTPCLQDENDVRALFGLQKAPKEVEEFWASTGGIKKPTTIKDSANEVQEIEEATDNTQGE